MVNRVVTSTSYRCSRATNKSRSYMKLERAPSIATIVLSSFALSACSTGEHTIDYASSNTIAIKYAAWDSVPTLTAQAIDMAKQHCGKLNLHANYMGGRAVNAMISPEEVHSFACERTKRDDGVVLAGQSQRPDITYVQPQKTSSTTTCSSSGYSTTCTSY